jgi:phosphatidylserine decarboxylase
MGIHKEGYPTLIISFLILTGIVISLFSIFPEWLVFNSIFGILAAIFWVLILSFFRYPKFLILKNQNHILSPADGKIVVIEKTFVDEFKKEERIQVSIFMSPADTHMNRYPIDGVVDYYKYHPGKHYVAWLPKSSTDNERTTIWVSNDKISIMMRQIAGALARRIVCYAKEDQSIEQGSQLGFIKFGSRVDVFLPLDTKINVKLNETVRAGKTVLAEI